MTRVIDYTGSGDHRAVVAEVLEAARAGQIVGLPCESGYLLVASSTQAAPVSELLMLAQSWHGQPLLALAHAEQLSDFVEVIPPTARRLVRRAWPGPVVVEFAPPMSWDGPPVASPLVQHIVQHGLRCGAFNHPLMQVLARAQQEPLLVVPAPPPAGQSWCQADGLELAQVWGEQVGLIVNGGFIARPQAATAVQFADSAPPQVTQLGAYNAEQIHRLMAKLTLFVCTGNTCRSPMAEGLFRRQLCQRLECSESELTGRGYLVASAGVASVPGAPASRETLAYLQAAGIDLSDHTSQPVTDQLLEWADLVFAMTERHRATIVQAFPEFAEKVERICPDGDIADPYGGDQSVYAECAGQIRECLEHWLELVVNED